jgi:dTMP kinase
MMWSLGLKKLRRLPLSEGLFITFEGGEGAGKTTLMAAITKRLSSAGLSVIQTREPGGTPLGEQVRMLLLQKAQSVQSVQSAQSPNRCMSPYAELCLFLASRAEHIQEVIKPALEQKKIVLCDRFNDSSIAYQGAARGLGMKEVAQFCSFISQGLEPHLTFYLDIDPTIGLKRVTESRASQDRIESEKILFHQKIREAYHLLHEQNPKRLYLLDALQPPAGVFSQAMRYLEPLLIHV